MTRIDQASSQRLERGKTNKGAYRSKSNTDSSKFKQKDKTTLTGDTLGILGHIFQIASEQQSKSEFQDTMDQLKVYISARYKKELLYMKKLFNDLETPTVKRPKA